MGESWATCPYCRREPGAPHAPLCPRFAASDLGRQRRVLRAIEDARTRAKVLREIRKNG